MSENKTAIETPKPCVKLVGRDGNAFAIMGACQAAARKAGWKSDKINEVVEDMMSGDYGNLLRVACKHFDVR